MAAPPVELSIVVPVYNEAPSAEQALEAMLDLDLPVAAYEIVVVDDGSTDGTAELLAARDWPGAVRVVRHDRNRGKGAAVRTGLAHARGPYTTIMDADLEYDPGAIAELLPVALAGEADAVYGVRGFQAHSAFSFWYVLGNKLVTLAANVLYDSWIADLMTCHKLMSTELFRSLALRENGFGIEPEITARLLRRGARIYEVPVTYRARTRTEGKKLTATDGLRVLMTLVRCRFA